MLCGPKQVSAPMVLVLTLLLSSTAPALAGGPGAEERARLETSHTPNVPASWDGSCAAAIQIGLASSPQIRVLRARWERAVHEIRTAGVPPEPRVAVSAFPAPIETRVGPQQARVSLQQAIPWPTELLGARGAAAARAKAAWARHEDGALALSEAIAHHYWALWKHRAEQTSHALHRQLMDNLAETLRARVEIGAAALSDLQQVELMRARVQDTVARHHANTQVHEASLKQVMGGFDAPITLAVPVFQPLPSDLTLDDLLGTLTSHPTIQAIDAALEASDQDLRATRGQRGPGLELGADWTMIGPSTTPDDLGSGRDALGVTVGVRVPLWHGATTGAVNAALAERSALEFEREQQLLLLRSRIESAWVKAADQHRRLTLLQDTLQPQAASTYTSLLGAYTAGEATVSEVLAAQQVLHDLRLEVDAERAAAEQTAATLTRWSGLQFTTSSESSP